VKNSEGYRGAARLEAAAEQAAARAMPMDLSANNGVKPEDHPLSAAFRMSVAKAANRQCCIYAAS